MVKLNMSKTFISPKSMIALILIISLCLIARIYKISLDYGVYITFSSFFLFVVLRLFGTAASVISSIIVNTLAVVFFNCDMISMFVTLEVLFVGLTYKLKTHNMFLSELVYWIAVGVPITALFFYFYSGEFGIDGYVSILNQAIIGLINVFLCDILLSYVNPENVLKPGEYFSIDFGLLLFHLTLISVLGPFVLFVLIDGWHVNTDLNNTIIKTIESQQSNILKQLKNWTTTDLRKVRLNSPVQIGNMQSVLDTEIEGTVMRIAVQDNQGNTYVSNKQTLQYENSYDWELDGKTIRLSNDVSIWRPDIHYYYSDTSLWKYTFFVKETSFQDIDLKLVIKIPLLNYSEDIWRGYLNKFCIIIISCILATILSIAISRFLSGALLKLADSTTDIPDKLIQQEKINWPNTSISQIKSLILNFSKMSDKLEELFIKEKEMNNQLLFQTNELRKSKEELKRLAYYDVLTDLPNRLYFIEYLKKAIKEYENLYRIMAIMFIDLNRFKQVNDSLGHEVGDMLLKEVAKRFKGIIKNDTFVARLGGDEFVVILEGADKTKAADTAAYINKILSDKISILYNDKEIELFTSGSIGISLYPIDSNNMNHVLKNADFAMYSAKKTGGNTYCFYEEICKEEKEEQIQLEIS